MELLSDVLWRPLKHLHSLRVDIVLGLVVPRVNHAALLREVEIAVGVAELLGLRGQFRTGNVSTHKEVPGSAGDATHDQGEGVKGGVALGHAVDHGGSLLDVLHGGEPRGVRLQCKLCATMAKALALARWSCATTRLRSVPRPCGAWEADARSGGRVTHVGGEAPGHVRGRHGCLLCGEK